MTDEQFMQDWRKKHAELHQRLHERFGHAHPKPPPLSLMGIICDQKHEARVRDLITGHRVFFSLIALGVGTATSPILNYLGLGQREKVIFLSVMPTELAIQALQGINQKLEFKKPGHGVAFTVNVHEGCYHRLIDVEHDDDCEDKTMESQYAHDLIMVVINRGYTEDVMDVARAAGATGGTVIHARGSGISGAQKFLGVTLQPEKELMFILAKSEISGVIMRAISEKAGPGTPSNAFSFALPASSVHGIEADVPDEIARK